MVDRSGRAGNGSWEKPVGVEGLNKGFPVTAKLWVRVRDRFCVALGPNQFLLPVAL